MIGISKSGLSSRGFTLIEVAISIGLIAIALMAVFRLQAQSLDLQAEAKWMTAATLLAQDRISRIKAGGVLREGASSGDFGDEFPDYLYEEDVTRLPGRNLYKIRVRIVLRESHPVKEFTVDTYLYRRS